MGHWSRTQQVVALSSCEAELSGICKAAQEGLAAKHLSHEIGKEYPLCIYTDSSAARGVVQRQGAGKVKHLSVRQLWVQEREARKELTVCKVPREKNWADLLTHHATAPEASRYLSGLAVIRRGEAEGATPSPRGGVLSRTACAIMFIYY